ncbi:MAG TPA: ABC transporter permease [candidate division Zixibacteria bacterium]|nr:ABC transporter permease [candidate division Zixibacteria bacterium]MDD4917534.1 ABC transporter permease [candidate division Zixibacteria bacterium]MDM7972197.1 ABC transporter permease [candidate division Zixibacteria bacterium]HOD67407.1 ABC transporter permease [candidate division Zixibacteria bacterium]HOZ06791.1 ABC transporter permease [candidate division Zixibacteria bacterium]
MDTRALRGLVRKEFIQVFRDRNMLLIIFAMPVVQLIIFGYVANTEVREVALDVYDFDRTAVSRQYATALGAGNYFTVQSPEAPLLEVEERFRRSDAEMALVIPPNFTRDLTSGGRPVVGIVADGANSNTAAIGMGYLARISAQYARGVTEVSAPVRLRFQVLYNPEMESVYFMVPGIVAALLTMVTVMLTSMAVVRERERGTLEQLLVTPISTVTLLLGKLLPFAVLGIVEMILALTIGVLWFGIPFAGSVPLLFALSGLYLFSTLGIGLFFSTITSTQQQAMFFAWFFSVFALLTSGLFTPISNMPQSVQYLTYVNPMRYFMDIARGIMMRGAGVGELAGDIWPLAVFGAVVLSVSIMRFSKRTA